MLCGNEQYDTPRLPKFESCLDVPGVKYSLHRQRVQVLAFEDTIKLRVDLEQTRRKWLAGIGSYRAEEERSMLRAIRFDDAIAGAFGSGINAQNSPHEASLSSAASMSKLDQTFCTSSWSSRASISFNMV